MTHFQAIRPYGRLDWTLSVRTSRLVSSRLVSSRLVTSGARNPKIPIASSTQTSQSGRIVSRARRSLRPVPATSPRNLHFCVLQGSFRSHHCSKNLILLYILTISISGSFCPVRCANLRHIPKLGTNAWCT